MNTNFTHTWEQAVSWLRSQPEQQALVKYCYYDDPIESAAERFSNSQEWLAVEKLLQGSLSGKVLDLGAGRGISSYAFAKAGCNVTALEPDPSALVGAQAIQSLVDKTGVAIQTVREYGETLPFAANTFDIVYGRAVLHHAQDLDKLCSEAARVLKPKGIFIATREHIISRKEDLPTFLQSHPLHNLYGGENAYLLTEYTNAIKKAGLKLKSAIAPYQSVINYAPMTEQEFQAKLSTSLTAYCGGKLAATLATNKLLQKLYSWLLSQKSNYPGRHYSFLAAKP
ncbi:class I SAM-dependent methyltransferase [Synechocystis sp. PCC 7509]|uniref:class I SAM-dependent methyltransferase n=1 Tax=Synechocystis sp. PCC 7509 TaxID=927677 RepID=UPI0002AC24D7|nr:methyltransferase domain-containing protein [Synechocystis sp. PCC 7509]